MESLPAAPSPITARLADHIAGAVATPLPAAVTEVTIHHILDTVAACVSGSRLAAGRAAAAFVLESGPPGEAVVIGSGLTTDPLHAALANAMAAHADESDDSHELTKSHPGCSIVPSVMATAGAARRTGAELVRAVALGYDIGCRVNLALWPSFEAVRRQPRGTPGIAGMFGSAAATAGLRGLEQRRIRYLLSYVAQQVAGMNTWKRDTEHVEKAYVLGGWPAFGALFAVTVVEAGWTGVEDVFAGEPNFLDIVGSDPEPARLVEGLGTRFEVTRTHIKRHAVGSPAQAPIQALLAVMEEHDLADSEIARVEVSLPRILAETVQRSRAMPDINLQYLLATVVADRRFSFSAAHDLERFRAWDAAGGDGRIEVAPDDTMESRRQAKVTVTTVDGIRHDSRVDRVHGSPENPMAESDVVAKAADLMEPVLGEIAASRVIRTVLDLETIDDIGTLTSLLAAAEVAPA